jgi:hypothetical protein
MLFRQDWPAVLTKRESVNTRIYLREWKNVLAGRTKTNRCATCGPRFARKLALHYIINSLHFLNKKGERRVCF